MLTIEDRSNTRGSEAFTCSFAIIFKMRDKTEWTLQQSCGNAYPSSNENPWKSEFCFKALYIFRKSFWKIITESDIMKLQIIPINILGSDNRMKLVLRLYHGA